MREYQTQNVQTFDDMYKQGWGNNWPSELMISYYHALIKQYVNFIGGGGKAKMLEFACGTGANLRFFDGEDFEVYGIDTSESAIDRCIQRGFKKENFSTANLLDGSDINDIWPDVKFDVIICLSSISYFNDHDIGVLNLKFYDALKERGVLYTNFYTTIREWPIRKLKNGLYEAESNGSVDKLTYLNLVEGKDDIRRYYKDLYEEIAIKRTLIEGKYGDNETLHFFGYRK